MMMVSSRSQMKTRSRSLSGPGDGFCRRPRLRLRPETWQSCFSSEDGDQALPFSDLRGGDGLVGKPAVNWDSVVIPVGAVPVDDGGMSWYVCVEGMVGDMLPPILAVPVDMYG